MIVAFALAAVSLIAFVLFERRSASPMLDLALFRSPGFLATSLIAMISFLGLIGFFFVLSLYFGMVQQLNTLQAGYRLLMLTAVCLIVGPLGRPRDAPGVPAPADHDRAAAHRWRTARADLARRGHRVRIPRLAPRTARAGPRSRRHPHDGDRRVLGTAPPGRHGRSGQQRAAPGRRRARPGRARSLLTSKSTSALPDHLADAGLTGATADRIVATVDAQGLGAVARMNLGANRGRALGALSQSFLDGMQLCLIVAACLALLAALVSIVLLGRRRPVPQPSAGSAPQSEPSCNS